VDWRTIHEFWFPAELARGELAFHMKMGDWWMRGGAMVQRFPELEPIFRFAAEQVASNIDVIERFGRFPHRNDILGRTSTDQERAYIDAGEFVHLRRPNA